MMYVKVVHPLNRSVMTFEAGAGEVYHERLEPMTRVEIQVWTDSFEDLRYDSRVLMCGMSDPRAATRITIPGSRGRQPIEILTNYDVWLVNDRGQNIDRLHRYVVDGLVAHTG